MASTSTSGPSTSASNAVSSSSDSGPDPSSVQFARGILLRFSIWPTLKTAVAEQWGGPDSQDKRDFLVGHLVDEYGMPALVADQAASSSSSGSKHILPAPLDVDDLADVIQDYVEQEYECLIEDDSVPRVAHDLVALHRAIFITAAEDGGASAQQLLSQLEQATSSLRGVQVQTQRQSDGQGDSDEDQDGGESEEEEGDGDVEMQEDEPSSSRPSRQEPEVDEDGFTTVQSGRRRRH